MNLADRRFDVLVPSLCAGVIALASFSALHVNGIGLTPDGWAYWQGAVSLAAGKGFTYLSGAPIVEWTPLYSLYLAAWSRLLGPTATGIIVANGALIALQSFLWCWSLLSIWRQSGGRPQASTTAALVVYLGLFIPLTQQSVLADVLKFTLLPLLLTTAWKMRHAADAAGVWRWASLNAAVAAALLLTHNNSIALVAANAVAIIVGGRAARVQRSVAALFAAAAAVTTWVTVRHTLGQDHSHVVGFGVGRYAASAYVQQLVRGTGSLIVPDHYGAPFVAVAAIAVLFAAVSRRSQARGALTFVGVFAVTSAAVTFALFNLSWVNDPLAGRFLLFVPLVVLPPLFLASADWSRTAAAVCVIVALGPQFYWTAAWVRTRSQWSLQQAGQSGRFAPWGARLSPDTHSSAPEY